MRFFLVSLLILNSCSEPKSPENKQNNLFNLENVLKNQEIILKNKSLEKTVEIDGKKESINLKDVNWSDELKELSEADINKSAYQNAFIVNKTDTSENYVLKPSEDIKVKNLLIEKDKNQKIKSIKADINIDNYLFKTHKVIEMHFNGDTLSDYIVVGTQKLFIGKPDSFKVIGRIKN